MTEQLSDITIGDEDADANPFGRDLPKEQKPPSLLDRAVDTAVANWYENTLAGSAVAWGQHAYDLAVINAEKGADSDKNLTPAQLAAIRNKAYPEAATFGEKAADVLGGFAGMAASPENFMLPGVRAAEAVAGVGKAAKPLFPKIGAAVENMPGIAQRMIDTGAGQAVITALTNPVIQNNRIQAGLQREFDGWEMGLAPFEGFAMGAVLHGAFEGAGMAAKAGVEKFKGSASGQAMQAGFEDRLRQTMMDRIKENDPGFKTADDLVRPAPAPAEPADAGVTGEVTAMPAAGEAPASEAPAAPAIAEPPPAVEAATKASSAIREAEQSGNLASIPKAAESPAAEPTVEGGPAGVFMFDPTTLKVDAKRFQFKEGGDEQGVTTALKGVTKWDRAKGNQVIVWQDKDGDFYVVDGHQRSGLARRLIESGKEKSVELPGLLYREADGVTAEDARAIAAVKNIAEGSGSALDGAKVLRSRPDLMDGSLPLSAGKGRQAAALSRLDDEAFRMVVNEVIPDNYGAIVGERIQNDGPRQIAAIKAIAKFHPSNEMEAATLVQRVAQAELEKAAEGAQGSMFGDLEAADSTAGSEMKIVGRAIKELQKDKTLFQRVVANASRIEETGSNIERAAAKEVTSEAELFARRLASDAYTPGPLRDVLKAVAREYQNGQIEIGEATARIRSALRGAAETDGAARLGNRARGEQAAQAGQAAGEPGTRERAAVAEPGAEGKPQLVIPGAERASDATMAQRQAEAPMRGGDEPPGGMFDEANTNQTDLQFRRGAPNYPPEVARDIVEKRGQIIQSLQRQAFDLADMMGNALRTGRVEQQALGQFEKKFGVARVRNIGDFAVVAHEMGHALENKFGQDVTNIINRNAAELAPLDPNGTNSANEGFAEWVSNYLTNKAYAVRQAPQTAADLTRFLQGRDSRLLEGMDRAADNFNAYITASSGERIAATVVPMEEQGWFSELKRTYKEAGLATTIGRVLADSYVVIFDSYAPLNRAVRDLARMARDRSGQLVDLRAADNPEVLMRMWMGRSAQGAYHQMRYGVVPYREVAPKGPSLHDAIALATGQPGLLGRWDGPKVEQFSEYMTAKRADVLWDKYASGEIPNPPTSFSQADAKAHIAQLAADNPNFEAASQLVHEYTRQLLKKQLDAGLIKKELYDKLSKEAFYVPMFRDVSDKPMAAGGGGGSSPEGPGQTQTVRALKGSSRDIIDPLQGLMQQTFLVERTIRHNDVIQSLVNLAERAGAPAGHLVEPLKAHEVKKMSVDIEDELRKLARQKGVSPLDTQVMMSSVLNTFSNDPLNATIFWKEPAGPRGEPIAFYKDAGELKAVRFMAGREGVALYESVMSLPAIGQDLFNATLAFAGNIQRAGIVLNPTFVVSNYIRDQLAVGILRPDYIPFWDGAKGVWSEMTQNEATQLYGYFGGQSAGAYVNEPSARSKAIDVKSIGKRGYIAQHTGSLGDLLEAVQIAESGTRNSIFAKVYEQKLSQGLSPYEAAMEAAWSGTDILDFSRHGSKTYAVRQIIPFLNAHMQALDKFRRTMIEPLARAAKGDVLTLEEKQQVANAYFAMSKFAPVGAALGFIWAAIHSEDEDYRDADPKLRATHLVGAWNGKIHALPKPFELSLGFTAGEEAFRRFVMRDPRAAGSMVTAAWEVLMPPNPLMSSPLVKMAFEKATGVDTYTQRDIVPEALQKLPEEMQYTERTSPLAIGISKASKVISDFLNEATNKEFAGIVGFEKPWSPIKVEHMFGSAFGTSGRDAMAAAHWFAPGDDVTGGGLENSVFFRRWIKDPTRSSDTITRYYEHVGEKTGDYDKAKDGYNAAVKTNNLTDAQSIYRNLDESRKAYVVLNSGGDEEGKSVFSGNEKNSHPMSRARMAVQQLNAIARELSGNTIADSETGEPIGLSTAMRKSAIEAIHQLSAQEMRNALVMTEEPGYAGRKLLDVKKQYAVIEAISPALAQEVARRYAMAKVFTTQSVAAEWQGIKRELVRAGSQADIADRVDNIAAEGFEFGGEHIPRKKLKRAPIRGEAPSP